MKLPSISLRELRSDGAKAERARLHEACETHGFFTLRDTDLNFGLVASAMAASRGFFETDEARKCRFAQDRQVVVPRSSRGYSPVMGETLHPDSGPDRKQCFDFGIERPLNGQVFVGPTLAPSDREMPGFSWLHARLQSHVLTSIVPVLLRSFALGLGQPKNALLQYFRDPVLIHRTIYYPGRGGNAGKHTDNGVLTLLFQEASQAPSLRVECRNEWIRVPSEDGAIVVNLGDMLQKWTGGRYVSTPHSVEHDSERSRISIPFFVYPDIDACIEPFDGGEPFRTRDVMLANYRSIWVSRLGAGRARELSSANGAV